MFTFIARAFVGSIFISGGLSAIKSPGPRTAVVEKAAGMINVDLAEAEAETLVKLNGAVMLGAGSTLALGLFPRLSAAALIASLVPTTVAGHPFWKETDPQAKNGQRIQFLKNLAIVGGLMLVPARVRKEKPVHD